jgi:hypothetical protein
MTSKSDHAEPTPVSTPSTQIADHERFGTPDDRVRMTEMMTGYRVTQIVSLAAAYSLAERMSDRPVSAEEIAAAEGLSVDATFRFLRACASIDLVTFDEASKRFAGTPLLGTLHKDNPASLRSRVQVQTFDPFWLAWGRLAESIRTGEGQVTHATGRDLWAFLGDHPKELALFAETMKGFYPAFERDAMELVDTQSVGMAVDVGGAGGSFVHALMLKNPLLHGAVFDLPFAVSRSAGRAGELGLHERFSTVAGDFFRDALPAADMYLLRFILHDWNDEACITILRNCRRSINAGGRLLVSEHVVGTSSDAVAGPLLDLFMLVTLGGKERSEDEFAALFAASGFRLKSVQPTSTPFSLIEAIPV